MFVTSPRAGSAAGPNACAPMQSSAGDPFILPAKATKMDRFARLKQRILEKVPVNRGGRRGRRSRKEPMRLEDL